MNFSKLSKIKKFFFKVNFSRSEQKIFLQTGLQDDMGFSIGHGGPLGAHQEWYNLLRPLLQT